MNMRFIIIDDQDHEVALTKKYLERLQHPKESIWPAEYNTFNNWTDVPKQLRKLAGQGFNPETECCVLFLDLVLGDDESLLAEGVKRVKQWASTLLESYVIILHTRFAGAASGMHGDVDGILDKYTESADRDAVVQSMRGAISAAVRHWSERTKRVAPELPRTCWQMPDSPASRRAEAGLGRELIGDLVDQVAIRWENIQVDVLAGGYSGAFVLKIDGTEAGVTRSAICKVSRDAKVLDEEVNAFKRASTEYHLFEGMLPPMVDTRVQQVLTASNAYFLVQSTVPGETLEKHLLDRIRQGSVSGVSLEQDVARVIDRLTQTSITSLRNSACVAEEPRGLQLLQIDVDRFESSVDMLADVRDECVKRGYLEGSKSHDRPEIHAFRDHVVRGWRESRANAGLTALPLCEQHGDLNPRNILIGVGLGMHLIDFARFGPWPVGYDLIRLELQLMLRLLDVDHTADAFGDRLPTWMTLWGDCCDAAATPDRDEGTTSGDVVSFRWVSRKLSRARVEIAQLLKEKNVTIDADRLTATLRTFDAIKMCSYQDATHFKRLLFLIVAIDSARAAGLMPALSRS